MLGLGIFSYSLVFPGGTGTFVLGCRLFGRHGPPRVLVVWKHGNAGRPNARRSSRKPAILLLCSVRRLLRSLQPRIRTTFPILKTRRLEFDVLLPHEPILLIQPLPIRTAFDNGLEVQLICFLQAPLDKGIADFLSLMCRIYCEDVEGDKISRGTGLSCFAVLQEARDYAFGIFLEK